MSDEKERSPFGVSMTKRYVSPGGERELYRQYEVGLRGACSTIELVDYMGGDDMVERVATAGHGRAIFPEQPSQQEFIGHLAACGLYEPFKSVQLKLSMRVPIETALMFVYEPAANVNEYSGRYSVMINSSYLPSIDEITMLLSNANGSHTKQREQAEEIHALLAEGRTTAYGNYERLIQLDLARELSRIGLGIDNDTQFFWKANLPTIARLYNRQQLRGGPLNHTRCCMNEVAELAKAVSPLSWHALTYELKHKQLPLALPSDDAIIDSSLASANWQPQETRRVIVPALEEMLFRTETFLNHGEFQVVDYMGDDGAFAQAARTSYGSGTKTLQDDKNLIRGLIRDLHTSPIEMAELAFESKAPVFIDPRQAGRHRTLDNHGFMGYTPLGSQFYEVPDSEMKYQDRKNRQGRGKEMEADDITFARSLLTTTLTSERERAAALRSLGTPEHIVRLAKGVGFYTKRWRTGDTHNLGHFLRLRLDTHAQKEIRDYAQLVARAVEAHTPIAWQAIQDYIINSMRFSVKEQELLSRFVQHNMLATTDTVNNLDNYKGVGFVVPVDKNDPAKGKQLTREGEAFKAKLIKLLHR